MIPTLKIEDIRKIFRPRGADSHKGTHGHAFLLAGSTGKMGAAVISSKACLRTGAGLLSVQVAASERVILQVALPEAMLALKFPSAKKLNEFSALAAGPGMGINSATEKKLETVIANAERPLLLDADALTILSKNKALAKKLPSKTILTPHVKEFDRMYGEHRSSDERIAKATEIAKKQDLVIVLKNASTFIATTTDAVMSNTGNSGLAKGGSGDALTGMILAFLAQGYHPQAAAWLGVYLHGLAAELSLDRQSVESMLISDVTDHIGMAFKALEDQ